MTIQLPNFNHSKPDDIVTFNHKTKKFQVETLSCCFPFLLVTREESTKKTWEAFKEAIGVSTLLAIPIKTDGPRQPLTVEVYERIRKMKIEMGHRLTAVFVDHSAASEDLIVRYHQPPHPQEPHFSSSSHRTQRIRECWQFSATPTPSSISIDERKSSQDISENSLKQINSDNLPSSAEEDVSFLPGSVI